MDTVERRLLGTVTCFATQEPVAALTFDDGPHPEFTPLLLDILKRHRARATFFMVGESAARHPTIVQKVRADGHSIGNHSWDHPSFPLISSRTQRFQIRACEKALAPQETRIFRPPYGHQNRASRLAALGLGYEVVTWSVVAEDWLERDAEWMASRILGTIHPGSIILLHDAIFGSVQTVPQENRNPMLHALELVLERLQDKFHFLTIPELLRQTVPRREGWWREATGELREGLRKRALQCHTA